MTIKKRFILFTAFFWGTLFCLCPPAPATEEAATATQQQPLRTIHVENSGCIRNRTHTLKINFQVPEDKEVDTRQLTALLSGYITLFDVFDRTMDLAAQAKDHQAIQKKSDNLKKIKTTTEEEIMEYKRQILEQSLTSSLRFHLQNLSYEHKTDGGECVMESNSNLLP